MRKNKRKFTTGFTIIEMMIAIAIFLIVVTIGTGALLNSNSVHNKTQGMRSILDNMTFIMEDMSKNIRIGYAYNCGGETCGTAKSYLINFTRPTDTGSQNWEYAIAHDQNNNNYYIQKTVNGSGDRITPEEISIDLANSGFWVLGAAETNDNQQPYVIINLSGTINYKGTTTPFSLHTGISQRKVDIIEPTSP